MAWVRGQVSVRAREVTGQAGSQEDRNHRMFPSLSPLARDYNHKKVKEKKNRQRGAGGRKNLKKKEQECTVKRRDERRRIM